MYFLRFWIAAENMNHQTVVKLVINNRNITGAIASVKGSHHKVMGGNTVIVRLNRGDKVWLEIYDTSGVQLYSKPDYRWVKFSGVLLYA